MGGPNVRSPRLNISMQMVKYTFKNKIKLTVIRDIGYKIILLLLKREWVTVRAFKSSWLRTSAQIDDSDSPCVFLI